ncbi:MAG TPA: radical SAM protein [Firmicutes bacterium]|nr:radical SAM protein [Bacillota bacterium]
MLGPDTLQQRVEDARKLASPCMLCGRRCRAERFGRAGSGEQARVDGVCKTGRKAVVSSHGPHFGEEPPITGYQGSGTIFFACCNLKCMFCQNYQIAHLGEGYEVDDASLAAIMISLQKAGCHNINLVSPTHVVPQILSALAIAVKEGLNIPLVYNSGGYDLPETINLLSGIVDIYMPDMKFSSGEAAKMCLQAPDYPEVNFRAVQEMHRQVGDLVTDRQGIAVRGLLVRHLVLPGDLTGTAGVMKFISEKISKDTYINIMDQYYPCHKAVGHPLLGRRITGQEHRRALDIARSFELTRLG